MHPNQTEYDDRTVSKPHSSATPPAPITPRNQVASDYQSSAWESPFDKFERAVSSFGKGLVVENREHFDRSDDGEVILEVLEDDETWERLHYLVQRFPKEHFIDKLYFHYEREDWYEVESWVAALWSETPFAWLKKLFCRTSLRLRRDLKITGGC